MDPGALIGGRFEIERRVGAGGMGTVFRALDRMTGVTVAVKVLKGDVDQGLERFMREAATLARVRHPDVVEYVAHGPLTGGGAYLVTEWIEGETLGARLGRGLSVREALLVARCVARALGAGHRAGVVHRDVKPGNVMLVGGEPARAKLLDFGIARLGSDRTLTGAGMMLGTPGYMAPEQARGARDVGPTADVFGLGAILYRCLAGRAPFAADSHVGVLAKTLFDDPAPLEASCPEAAGPLADAVHAMLSKDPAQRPADGDVAAELLERLIARVGEGGAIVAPTSARELPSLTRTERRIVTVLFVDPNAAIDDTPTIAESSAPSFTPGGPLTEAERNVAAEHGLRLERLASGARVLTLAGVGSAKDQALRVVRAALALAPLSPGATLGVATGRGEIRGQSAVGEAIERAERTTRGRDAATLLVDDVTAGLVQDAVELARAGQAWRVLGERTLASGARTLLGKPTPCLGRERELAMLGALVEESVEEGVARVAVVTAPAGYGKSRLRHEWLARLANVDPAPRVLEARADPMHAGSPLGMLRQLLAQAMGVRDGDAPDVARARVGARAAALFRDKDRARVVELVSELLGCGAEEASDALAAARRDPVLLGDQLHRAALDVLASLLEQGPLALVLEDLHWGDLPTVRFVGDALRTLASKPLVVVAFARPEIGDLFPDLWAERGATTMRLGELTKGASERLVRAALGDVAPELVARLVGRALGNPLFLEELIRAAAEGKDEGTPESVLVMMHARLDGFEADARRILRAASVFGQAFWSGGVRALALDADDAALDVDEWLRVLAAREVVARAPTSRFAGHDEYAFRHALVREAAYDMLTEEGRRQGHRLAGAWLEGAGEGDGVALGEHFERGGEASRAARWFGRAAEQSLAGNDFAGAVRLARRSIALAPDAESAGPLQVVIAQASRWKGSHVEALDAALAARALLPARGALWYRALGEAAVESAPLGRSDVLDQVLADLLEQTPLPGAEGAFLAAASRTSTQLLLVVGRKSDAPALLERLFSAPAEVLERDPIARGCVNMSRAYVALAEADSFEYARHNRVAREAFMQAGDLRTSTTLSANIGYAAMTLGDLEASESALREALVSASRMGLRRIEGMVRHNLGLLLARRGQFEEAERVEREALDSLEAQGDLRLAAYARAYLADILRLAGKTAEALERARDTFDRAGAFPGPRAYARTVAAASMLELGDAAGALSAINDAVAIIEQAGGAEDGDAFMRWVHARALEASGDVAAARAAALDAERRLRERAARLPDDAARARFFDAMPEHAGTLAIADRLRKGEE